MFVPIWHFSSDGYMHVEFSFEVAERVMRVTEQQSKVASHTTLKEQLSTSKS